MAAGLLYIAIIFFSARGYFLALPGVVARLLGLISGYVIAFSYRTELASKLAASGDSKLHPLAIQVVSGAVLFFGTLFVVSLVVIGLFKLLTKAVPALSGVLSKQATGSRIAGALFNGAIGGAIVLSVLWLYGITLGKNQQPDELQRFANRFGDTLLAAGRRWFDDDETITFSAHPTTTVKQTSEETQRGTAEIFRSDDPQKRIFIEQFRQVFADQQTGSDTDLQTLLQNKDLQVLINDPEVQKKAMEYMQENPQQMMEALNNPRFRELLQALESR